MRLWALAACATSVILGCRDRGGAATSADAGASASASPTGSASASAAPTSLPIEHRAVATACAARERPAGDPKPDRRGCKSDAECKNGLNGRCRGLGGYDNNQCTYDLCMADSDCTPNKRTDLSRSGDHGVCRCGGTEWVNTCLFGNCRTDADCAQGKVCSPSEAASDGLGGLCGQIVGYYCRTDADECRVDADCKTSKKDPLVRASCAFNTDRKHWACYSGCGTP